MMGMGPGVVSPLPYSAAVIPVSGDPDGQQQGFKGQRAIDITNGVMYENEDGASSWWPISIPNRVGWSALDDGTTLQLSSFVNIGGGASSNVGATAANPGQRQLTASAAGVDAAFMRSGNLSGVLIGGGKYRFRWILKIPTLSDGVNNLVVRAGGGDSSTFADFTDGCYFEYDLATNGNHNWFLCTSANSVRTKTNTGIVATTNFVRLDGVVSADGSQLAGKIDGVAVTPVSTNLPTAANRQFDCYFLGAFKQLGAGALTSVADFIEANQVLTVSR